MATINFMILKFLVRVYIEREDGRPAYGDGFWLAGRDACLLQGCGREFDLAARRALKRLHRRLFAAFRKPHQQCHVAMVEEAADAWQMIHAEADLPQGIERIF